MSQDTPQKAGEQQTPARMSLLEAASSWLPASLDLDGTLQRAVRLPLPTLADGCVLQLLGDPARTPSERLPFTALLIAHVDGAREQHVQSMLPGRMHALHHCDGALEVVRTGRPQPVNEVTADSSPVLMRELSASWYSSWPLCARDKLLGVLTLVHDGPRQDSHASHDDDAFMNAFTRQIGIAIDNAQRHTESQRAIAMRDDMLAVVSHDLQSPLNAIQMTVRHLLNEPHVVALPGVKRALTLIERTTKHLGQLIAELMDVGSIQAGRLTIDARPTAIPPLLGDALTILEPMLLDKHLRVSTQLEPALPLASCDGQRILRVVLNLLGNAIKFTGEGGEVTLYARRVNDQLEVAIRDNGPGIAREELPKLFEPYWRSRQTGRRGMGLGLYIARGIVEAHGGHIWAESELGAGSTFAFRLAMVPAEST
ncbi:MAG TPA: ATP-binding protein [Polyangiales bacterium]